MATPAFLAIGIASAVGSPTVVSPSDMTTTAPSTFLPSVPRAWSSITCTASLVASPIAVDLSSSRPSIAAFTLAWSWVGGTSSWALPAKLIRPTLSWSGSLSMNSLAAAWAASIRFGDTSVAAIDSEVSMARTIVDRSEGTFSVMTGWANAATRTAAATRKHPATTWRRQPGRRGATESSSSRLEKRTA